MMMNGRVQDCWKIHLCWLSRHRRGGCVMIFSVSSCLPLCLVLFCLPSPCLHLLCRPQLQDVPALYVPLSPWSPQGYHISLFWLSILLMLGGQEIWTGLSTASEDMDGNK